MKIRPTRDKRKTKRRVRFPHDRLESDPPRDEYQWLARQKSDTPTGAPPGLSGMSADPQSTIAWVRANCRFVASYNPVG